MYKKTFITLILLGICICTHGQISHGGKPYSLTQKSLKSFFAIETLPLMSNQVLMEEEIATKRKDEGYQFGKEISVNYGLDHSGTWEELPNGGRLWRLGVESKGAYSINLIFDNFHIPSASNFFIYTADYSYILGSFTSANNNQWSNFATSPLPGDAIVLEFYESPKDREKGIINLTTIVHGYKDIFFKNGKAEKAAGTCNINVNCEIGFPYKTIKQSVVQILYRGSAFCTGTLINNTAQDTVPYILTAFHCVDVSRDLELSPEEIDRVKSWVFIFNNESSDCEGQNREPRHSINGATLIATHKHSDFALILMNDKPTEEFKPYYAGWNRNDIPPNGAICIHHPSGDIKKISIDNKLLTSGRFWDKQEQPSFPNNTHFITVWDTGTTEGGSSGSGLFNKYSQIIGQLQGGDAGCDNLNGEDYFGKIAYSWTNNNNSDSNRLDYWLDPLKSGKQQISGFDPYGVLAPVSPMPSETSIQVFPNPASSDIYIIDDSSQLINLTAYDIFGRKIMEITEIGSHELILNIGRWNAGMYVLKISTNRGVFVKKIIKEPQSK